MYKFLLIEDDKDDREAFKDSLDLLNIEKDEECNNGAHFKLIKE